MPWAYRRWPRAWRPARREPDPPVLLGAHQFIEALVWLWLQGHVPRGIGHVALWAYLLIAFVVLPVSVPLAVIAAEPARRRKQVMAPFALIGAVIAVTLFAAMVRGPVGVKLAPYHLSYVIRLPDGLVIVALYVIAVCGPLLVSRYRNVVLFGVVNLIAVVVIARLTISGFASVWCGWAAVSSAAITLHCRFARPRPQRAPLTAGPLSGRIMPPRMRDGDLVRMRGWPRVSAGLSAGRR